VFKVYILYSIEFDKFYVGQTNNLEDRFFLHNSGKVKSSAPYKPWIMKGFIEKKTRAEAMQLEKKIKNLSKNRIHHFILKHCA
jgi:putative endonuclease